MDFRGAAQVGLLMAISATKWCTACASQLHGFGRPGSQDLEVAINYQPWHPSHYLRDYMLASTP